MASEVIHGSTGSRPVDADYETIGFGRAVVHSRPYLFIVVRKALTTTEFLKGASHSGFTVTGSRSTAHRRPSAKPSTVRGVRKASSSPRNTSFTPPRLSTAMIGVPQARASVSTMPRPSYSEASTNRSACFIQG